MAATTSKILPISAIYVLYDSLHPLHIAKYGATLGHISKGRWGINVATGHRAIEHQMFGWKRAEHAYATENIAYEGRVSPWKLEDVWVTLKPLYGRPVLVNATGSPAGVDFAVKYSDLVFITSLGGADIHSALKSLPDYIAGQGSC
ncbi:luciferase-like domain-containing protein [Aspergillus undulatus]|uniref:luciferase-like domain-containing protein n=1 Tax=Aspergillus undulatus TaxID=1810928 RepID=UPI003CCCF289